MTIRESLTGIALAGMLIFSVASCDKNPIGRKGDVVERIGPSGMTAYYDANGHVDGQEVLYCGTVPHVIYDKEKETVYVANKNKPLYVGKKISDVDVSRWENSLRAKLRQDMPDSCP